MDRLLRLSSKAGKMLLESGAETYRVEETMVRICESFNVSEVNSFVLPTGIFMSFVSQGKTYSLVTRIKSRNTDLYRIDQINQLSRLSASQVVDLDEFEMALNEIEHGDRYSDRTVILCAAFSAFSFTFFFGGTWLDACIAFLIAFILKIVLMGLEKIRIVGFVSNIIGGFVTTLFALIFREYHLLHTMDTVIISTLMLMVPGIAIMNAIRDSISGDLVSGVTRSLEAFLIAISIALGTGCALSIWVFLMGGY